MKSPAKIVKAKPSEVTAFLSLRSQTYEPGMVIVDIQELNLFNIICRWSLPFWIQPQVGWKVWVEPTWGESERWILSGIENLSTITDTDMLIIDLPAGDALIKVGNNKIKWDNITGSLKLNDTSLEVKI